MSIVLEIWGKMGVPRDSNSVMIICPLFAKTTPTCSQYEFDDIADLTLEYILHVELYRLNPVIHGIATKLKPV